MTRAIGPSKLARLARMDLPEIGWRSLSVARATADRLKLTAASPAWNRRALARALEPTPGLQRARTAIDRGDWREGHAALSRHFFTCEPRFVVGASMRSGVAARLVAAFPGIADQAAEYADRVVAGAYDLLGYRGLRFGSGSMPDWAYDPVHDRRPPRQYWTRIRYLDPACGDHKIIWELNRHQHWMVLGRAYWLTGSRAYRNRFVQELGSWLTSNPYLIGINWASMLELALRSLSWLWALHFFVDEDPTEETPWTLDLLLALDCQLTQVERHLSIYFSPNTHLLGEALALYVAGRTLPELAGSRRRQNTGRALLIRESSRQIGSDGGHLERSTHYHRYAFDFYLLAAIVARITHDPARTEFDRVVTRLAHAARLMADDSGRAPHIGDDDGGALLRLAARDPHDLRGSLGTAAILTGDSDLDIGASPEEAYWMLAHPSVEGRFPNGQRVLAPQRVILSGDLPDTGYYISRSRQGDHLVIDGGRHGYQNGGHAHADALSITLTLGGVPLLIDPGTGCYTTDPIVRERFRSTALHNTVLLDGRSQSEPRGPFHWGPTADSCVECWRVARGFDFFDGWHDGYHPIRHRRLVFMLHADLLVVADWIGGAARAAVHWHIDPRWTVNAQGGRARFTAGASRVGLTVPLGAVEPLTRDGISGLGWHSPVYGRIEANTTLRIAHRHTGPFWLFSVFDFRSDNRVRAVEIASSPSAAGCEEGTVLRISRAHSVDYFAFSEAGGLPASPPMRVDEVLTDARVLFARKSRNGTLKVLALVDGSFADEIGDARGAVMPPQRPARLDVDRASRDHSNDLVKADRE